MSELTTEELLNCKRVISDPLVLEKIPFDQRTALRHFLKVVDETIHSRTVEAIEHFVVRKIQSDNEMNLKTQSFGESVTMSEEESTDLPGSTEDLSGNSQNNDESSEIPLGYNTENGTTKFPENMSPCPLHPTSHIFNCKKEILFIIKFIDLFCVM